MTVFDKINLVFLWSSNNANMYFWEVWKETHGGSSLAKISNIYFHAWETEMLANKRNMLTGGWRNTCLCLVQCTRTTAEEWFSLAKLLGVGLSCLFSVSAKISKVPLCKSALPGGLSILNIQISKTILLLSFMNQYLCSTFSILLFVSFFISFLARDTSLVHADPNVMQNQINVFNSWKVSYVLTFCIWVLFFSVLRMKQVCRQGQNLCLPNTLSGMLGFRSHKQGSVRLPQVKIKCNFVESLPY